MTQESSIPPVAALERNRREILAAIERNSERIAPHPVLCRVTRLSSGESAQMPNEGYPPMKRQLRLRATSAKLAVVPGLRHNSRWPTKSIREGGRMYAICFDLDTEALNRHHPGNSPNYGYYEIRCILAKHGFSWQQGSVYFGEATSGCYGSKRTMI